MNITRERDTLKLIQTNTRESELTLYIVLFFTWGPLPLASAHLFIIIGDYIDLIIMRPMLNYSPVSQPASQGGIAMASMAGARDENDKEG